MEAAGLKRFHTYRRNVAVRINQREDDPWALHFKTWVARNAFFID